MSYQEVLKSQLNRRIEMNPQYSLRAFAKLIQMSPSKVSEILNGKKGISLSKANEVCVQLRLTGSERDLFLLSVESQHSRLRGRRKEASEKLLHLHKLASGAKNQTEQKCAWYYSAVEAFISSGVSDARQLSRQLGLTSLQVENAKRFLKRREKNWPERKRIRIEESSLLRKIQSQYEFNPEQLSAEGFFVSGSEAEFQKLQDQIRQLIEDFKSQEKTKKVYLLNLNCSEI